MNVRNCAILLISNMLADVPDLSKSGAMSEYWITWPDCTTSRLLRITVEDR
jgi:hypothetical protein